MNNLELTLKLTVAEMQIVLAGLGKLPMEASLDVWGKLKSQAEAQIKENQSAANDEIQAEDPPSAA